MYHKNIQVGEARERETSEEMKQWGTLRMKSNYSFQFSIFHVLKLPSSESKWIKRKKHLHIRGRPVTSNSSRRGKDICIWKCRAFGDINIFRISMLHIEGGFTEDNISRIEKTDNMQCRSVVCLPSFQFSVSFYTTSITIYQLYR